ncbi:MAG: hypothetical protein Q7S76_02005, partial [bacterium]|nr:hypothetical protein [bacterium]
MIKDTWSNDWTGFRADPDNERRNNLKESIEKDDLKSLTEILKTLHWKRQNRAVAKDHAAIDKLDVSDTMVDIDPFAKELLKIEEDIWKFRDSMITSAEQAAEVLPFLSHEKDRPLFERAFNSIINRVNKEGVDKGVGAYEV